MSARAHHGSAVAEAKANKAGRPLANRVCLGRVGSPRGLKGEVRVRAFTANPRDIAAYGPVTDKSGTRSFTVAVVSETGEGGVIARLSGINDRTQAEKLKGLELFVARAALPKLPVGEYYHSDLIGLEAVDPAGRALGRIDAIHDYGAGGILEIDSELWPAASIIAVDLAAGNLVLAERAEILAQEPPRKRKGARA